jgi:hypothetical protein
LIFLALHWRYHLFSPFLFLPHLQPYFSYFHPFFSFSSTFGSLPFLLPHFLSLSLQSEPLQNV